jgi:hypothetical protein
MNPFGTILPAAETVTKTVNTELLPLMREIVAKLVLYGDQWSANDVMGEIAAAEALVNVENGEIAVYGGYDTNDLRLWNAAFANFMLYLSANISVTKADGTTVTKTPKSIVLKYYAPVE